MTVNVRVTGCAVVRRSKGNTSVGITLIYVPILQLVTMVQNCQQYQDNGGIWKNLVCVKRYDSSKKKCWKDTTTDLQGHGQRCDK